MMASVIMIITRPMILMVVITSMDFGRTENLIKQKNIYDEETYVGKYKHNFNDIFSNDSLQNYSIHDHHL